MNWQFLTKSRYFAFMNSFVGGGKLKFWQDWDTKKYRYCLHVSVSLNFYVPLLSHTSSNTAKLNNDLPPGHFQNARRIAWPQWDCKRLSVMVIKICVGNRHKQNLCLVGRIVQAIAEYTQTTILERLCHSSRTEISWLLFLSVTVFSH